MLRNKAAVIGYPVKHSLSPALHGYWLEKYNIYGEYGFLEIRPEDLTRKKLEELSHEGYIGFNLTVPHKEIALNLVNEISDVAKEIGAVNTIKINDDGTLYGTNTDAFGFIENIRSSAEEFDFTEGIAVVLGAGGAARAVVKGLIDSGVPEVVIANRTRSTAEKLATEISGNITVINWDERETLLDKTNLLVNTTTLGMDGQRELELNLDNLPKTAFVTDIVYKPLKTKLLLEAEKRGNPIVDGLGMLLYQAVGGFELWFGVRPEVTDEVRGIIERKSTIALK